jgi:hypothetical protein
VRSFAFHPWCILPIARAEGDLPAQDIDFLNIAYAAQPLHHP